MAEESKELQKSPTVEELSERLKRMEASDAPLTQGDTTGMGKAQKPSGGGFGGMQFILTILIAAVISYVMLGMFAPKLSQYKDDINRLESDLVNVRANYAPLTSIPKAVDLTPINSQLTTIGTSIATAQTNISNLTAQIAAIKPFDPTALQTADTANAAVDTKNTADIATLNTQLATAQATLTALNTQYTALATQVSNLKPTDLTNINASITTLQASVATLQTSVTALQTSLATLTTSVSNLASPSIYVVSIANAASGMQATIHSSAATYVLATIKYTFAIPITPALPTTLSIVPFGNVVTGATITRTWDGTQEQQAIWFARVIVAKGDTTIAWQSLAPLLGGTWSIDVELLQ